MSDQAPKFTLKMSKSGVPWAGIVMTSIFFVLGSVLNALTPDAFEIAVEATSVMILFTWGTIFACQIRLRQLTDRGVIPKGSFQAPGSPYTSIIGLVFLVLVLIGLAISGWQSSPYLLHKTSFLVVVFGIPVLAIILAVAWRLVRPKVMQNTGGKIKSVWTLDGPRYGDDVTPDDLDITAKAQ
jgi:L-asparagine permease